VSHVKPGFINLPTTAGRESRKVFYARSSVHDGSGLIRTGRAGSAGRWPRAAM